MKFKHEISWYNQQKNGPQRFEMGQYISSAHLDIELANMRDTMKQSASFFVNLKWRTSVLEWYDDNGNLVKLRF